MPRGYRNMYAEFISVRRHILQVSATGEKDLLAKMAAHADGDWVEGLQVSDDSRSTLFHEPYRSTDVGPSDEGPTFFAGNPFGEADGTVWMRELAQSLQARADELDAGKPKERLLKHGLIVEREVCLRCGRKGCVEAALTPSKPDSQSIFKRCTECGYRQNLGWAGGFGNVVDRVRALNQKKGK